MTSHLKSIWHDFLEESKIYSTGFCWTVGFVVWRARESCGSVCRLSWKSLEASGAQESFSRLASASKLGPGVFCEILVSCHQPDSRQHFPSLNFSNSWAWERAAHQPHYLLWGLSTPLSMSFYSVCIIILSQGGGPCIHLALVNQSLSALILPLSKAMFKWLLSKLIH